jgi:hypothetical protein
MKVCVLTLLFCVSLFGAFTAPGANDHCYHSVTSGSSTSCTLGSSPATGKVVAVFVMTNSTTLSTVKDGAGTPNSYTITSQSPSNTNDVAAGSVWLAFFIATPTANAVITATVTGGSTCTIACSITVDVFGVVGGVASLDADAKSATMVTGAVVLPSIPVNNPNELIYGACADSNSCNGVTGAWIVEAHGLGSFGESAEYQLSVSSNTLVGFAGSVGNTYDSMGMSFHLTPSSANQFPRIQ